jgi:hypothetical protein
LVGRLLLEARSERGAPGGFAMVTPEQHDLFAAKIADGTMTHDDTADLFLLTTIGRSTGVTREALLERLRERHPDQQSLNAWLQVAYQQAALLFPVDDERMQ